MRTGRLVKARETLPAASAYEVLLHLAAGGMGTVYIGRRKSARVGRLYAIKRTHHHLLSEHSFADSLAREAWIASRIHHPNVVAVHDIEELAGDLLLVMDYVDGICASDLLKRDAGPGSFVGPIVSVIVDAASGLHAAHELLDEHGQRLNVVHRDVSPHNILVGTDGLARMTDFGVARARFNFSRTKTGILQGKAAYMAPEYITDRQLDARSDVFSLGVVAWELLCAKNLFTRETDTRTLEAIRDHQVWPPSAELPSLRWADESIMTALEGSPDRRYATAALFADAFLAAARSHGVAGGHADVAACVRAVAGPTLEKRAGQLRDLLRADDTPSGRTPAAMQQTMSLVRAPVNRANMAPAKEPLLPFVEARSPASGAAYTMHAPEAYTMHAPDPAPAPWAGSPSPSAPSPRSASSRVLRHLGLGTAIFAVLTGLYFAGTLAMDRSPSPTTDASPLEAPPIEMQPPSAAAPAAATVQVVEPAPSPEPSAVASIRPTSSAAPPGSPTPARTSARPLPRPARSAPPSPTTATTRSAGAAGVLPNPYAKPPEAR